MISKCMISQSAGEKGVEELPEFMVLYKAEIGEKLLRDEAGVAAGNLAEHYSLLAEHLSGEQSLPTIPWADFVAPASLL